MAKCWSWGFYIPRVHPQLKKKKKNDAKKPTCQMVLPMPKFDANMNYIYPSPPSSMKQRNKSATVKFHMELLLMLRPNLLAEFSFVTLTIHS